MEDGVGYFFVEAESEEEAVLLFRQRKLVFVGDDDDNVSREYFFEDAELKDE